MLFANTASVTLPYNRCGRPVRPWVAMMIPSVLEKASYAIAVAVLYLQRRVSSFTLGTAIVDSILGLLFIVAYLKTANAALHKSD